MAGDSDRSVRGVVVAVVAVVVIGAGAVVLPMVFAEVAPETVEALEGRVELAEERMTSAERAFEAEGGASDARGASSQSGDVAPAADGGTVTPAESPPEVHVVVADPNAKILGVWLRAKSSAPKPVAFDQSSDSVTVTFLKTGETRGVSMSDLFGGGMWTLAPGRMSSEARVNCPRGYTGTAEVEFLHVSNRGTRVSVVERVEVY